MSPDITNFLSDVWRFKPLIIIVASGGGIIFALLVVDTYRYRKKQKGRHTKKH